MIHNDCDEAYITTIQREKIPSRSSGKRTECHPVRQGRIIRRSIKIDKLNHDSESDEGIACACKKDHFYPRRKKKLGSDKRNAICYKATIEQEIISSACPNKKARNSIDQFPKSRQIKQTIPSCKESTSSMSFHTTRPDITINDEYSGDLCDRDVSFSDDYYTTSSSSESNTSSTLFSPIGQRINFATTGKYEPAECCQICEICDSNLCIPRQEERNFPSSYQQLGYLSEPGFYEEPFTSSRRGLNIETVPKRCVMTNIEPAVWDSDYPPHRAFISPSMLSCYCNEDLQSRRSRQHIQNSSSPICHNRESKIFDTDSDVVHTWSMVRRSNLPDKESGDVRTIDIFNNGSCFSHSSGGTPTSSLDIPHSTVSNRCKPRTGSQNSLSPNINAKYRQDGTRYPIISIQQDLKLSLKNRQENGGLKNVDTVIVAEDRLEENDKSAGMEIRIDIGNDRRPCIEYICNPRDIRLELPQTPSLLPKSDLSHGGSSMNFTSKTSPSYKHSPLATGVSTSDCNFMEITPAANKVARPWQIQKNRVIPQNESLSAREVTDEQYFNRKKDVSPKTVTIKSELDSDPRDSAKKETILTELTRSKTNLNAERLTSTKPEFEPFKSCTASCYPEQPHATKVPIRSEGEKRVVFSEPAKLPGTSVPDHYTQEPEKPRKDSLPNLKALISQINHFVGSRTSVPSSTSSDLEYVAQLKTQMENMKNTMNDWRSCAIALDTHQSKTLEGGGGKRITDRPGGGGSSIIMEVDNELRRLEDNFFQLEQKCLKLGLPFVTASKENKFEIRHEKRNASESTAKKNTFLHEFNERVQKLLNMTTLFHSNFPDENIVQETATEASETMSHAAKKGTPKKGPCSVCRKKSCVCKTKQREELSGADQIVKRLGSERSDNINLAHGPENSIKFVNEGTPTKTSASADKFVKFTDDGTPGSVTKSVKENYSLNTTCQLCRTKNCICKATQTSADKILWIPYEETTPDANTDDEMHAVLSTVIKDIRNKLVTVEDDLLSCKTNISQLNRKIDHSSKETIEDVENLQRSMIATMKDLVDSVHSLRSIGIMGQMYCGGQNSVDNREFVIGGSRMEAITVKEEEDEFKDANENFEAPFLSRTIFRQGYGAVKKSTTGTDEKCNVTQCDCIEKEVQVLTATHLTKENFQKPCMSCGNTECICVGPIMKVISKICNLLLEYKPLEYVSPNSEPISPEVHPQCVCGKSTPELPSGDRKSLPETKYKLPTELGSTFKIVHEDVLSSGVSQIKSGIHSETKSLDANLTVVCKGCGLPQCECKRCLTNQMAAVVPEGDSKIKRVSEKGTSILKSSVALPQVSVCGQISSQVQNMMASEGDSRVESEKPSETKPRKSPARCKKCGLRKPVGKKGHTDKEYNVQSEGDKKVISAPEKSTGILKSPVAPSQGCEMPHCVCDKSPSQMNEVAPSGEGSRIINAQPPEVKSRTDCKGCGLPKCVCKKCLTDKTYVVASEGDNKITNVKSSVPPSQGCGIAQCACGKGEEAPLEGDSLVKIAHPSEPHEVCKKCGKRKGVRKKGLTDKKSVAASEGDNTIISKKSSVAPSQGCEMAQCACGKIISEIKPQESSQGDREPKHLSKSSTDGTKSATTPSQGCGMSQCACGKSEVAPLEGDSPIKSAHSYEITSAVCKGCGKSKCVCKKCHTDKKAVVALEGDHEITRNKSSVAPSKGCGMAQCACGKTMESSQGDREPKHLSKSSTDGTKSATAPSQGCGMSQCACGKSEVAPLEGDSPIKSAHSYEITSAVCKGCGKSKCVCKKCHTDKKAVVELEGDHEITRNKSSVAPSKGCGMAQCACGKTMESSQGDREPKHLSKSSTDGTKSATAPSQGCGMSQCACGKSEVAPLEGDSPIKSAHSYEITSAVCKGCGKSKCVCKKCHTDKKAVVELEGDHEITRNKSSVAPSKGCGMAQCACGKTMESSQGDREPKHLSKSSTDGTKSATAPSQGCGMSQCACGKSEVAPLEGDSPIKSAHSYEITSAVCKGCGKSKCVCRKCLTDKKSVVASEGDHKITSKKSSIAPSQGCGMAQCMCGRSMNEMKPQESSKGDNVPKNVSERSPDGIESTAASPQGCGMAQCMCGKSPSSINVGIPTEEVSRIKLAPPSDSKSLESKSPAACKGCGKPQCVCKKCLTDKKSVLAIEVDNNITKKKSSILPSQGCGMAQCMCGRNMSEIESSPDEIKSYVASSQGCGMPQCACGRSQTGVKSHMLSVGDGQQKSQPESNTDKTDTQVTPSEECGTSQCVCGKCQTEGCGLSQCICKVCLTKERSMSPSGKDDQITSVPGNVSGSTKAVGRSSEGCGMPACTCGRSSSPEEIKSSVESLKGCRMPQCGCGKSQVPSEGDKESKILTEKSPEGITSREASSQGCGRSECACGQSLKNMSSVPTSEGDSQIQSMPEGCGKSRCTCGRTRSGKKSALVNNKERTRDKTPHSKDENKDGSSHPCGVRESESEYCLADYKYFVTEEEDNEFKDTQTSSENEEKEHIQSQQCGQLKSVYGKASSRGCGKCLCACKEIPFKIKGSSKECGQPECICGKCVTHIPSRSHVTLPEGCNKAQCIIGQDLTGPSDGDSEIRDKQENMKSTTTACQNCGLTQCICGNGLNKTSKVQSEGALQVKLSSKKCKNCGKRQCVCDKTAKNSSPIKSDSKKITDDMQNVATSSQGCSLLQCGCEKRQTQTDCRFDNAQGGCNKAQCVCGKSILINSEKRESEDSNNSSATNSGSRSSKKNKGKSKKRSSKRRGSESKEETEPEPEGCGAANCTCNDTAIAAQTAANNEVPVPGWFTNPFIVDYSTLYSLASNQPERDIPNSVLETLQQSLIPSQENQSQVSGNKAVTNYQYATVLHRTNPFYSDYWQPTLMESAGGIVTNNETVTDVKNFGKHLHNQYAAISFEFGSDSAVSNLLSPPFMKINQQQTHPQLSLPASETTVSSQGQGVETVLPKGSLLNTTISSQQTDAQNSSVILTDIVNHLNVLVQEMSKNKDEIIQLSSKMSEQLKNEQSTSSKRLSGTSLIVKSSIHRAKEANALEYEELQRIERNMTSAIATLTRNVDGMNAAKSLAESEIELKNIEMRLQQAEEELAVSLPSDDSDEFDNVD